MKDKDLTPVLQKIEKYLKDFFKTDKSVGMAIAFILPPKYDTCHWITNLNRSDGIKLFIDTAEKMADLRSEN